MGRVKLIESPEAMWGLFERYKTWAKEHPFKIKDWVGKDAEQVEREKERPLTMVGFESFVFNHGLNGSLSHYFSNLNESYTEYLSICSRIKAAITSDQIEGGMAGMYNPSITQRLNGLVERTETDIKATVKPAVDYTKLSEQTLKELADASSGNNKEN